jgi:hypothetical protein
MNSELSIEVENLNSVAACRKVLPTCPYCLKEIPAPRIQKGVIVQKFCNSRCRSSYHNAPKRKQNLDAFVGELKGLLEKMTDLLKRYHLQR